MPYESPATPPPIASKTLFVAVRNAVMHGARCIATACSNTMAKRIAAALNTHQPNRRGV